MPNTQCSDYLYDQQWRCMLTSTLTGFIDSDLFIVQSEYDTWFIPNTLGVDCIDTDMSLKKCSSSQMSEINDFRKNILTQVVQTFAFKTTWGGWMPACAYHVLTSAIPFNSNLYEVPM